MRLSRLLLFTTMLLVMLLFWGLPAFSQDPPEVALGTSPSATYHAGEFDFVDMATGRLNLHIPLVVDKSQRGKLNFTYSITYSSSGTWIDVITNRGNNAYLRTEPPTTGIQSPAFITDGLLYSEQSQRYHDNTNGHDDYEYWVPGSDGASHAVGGRETLDGTGLTTGGIYNVTNKDGISFGYNSTTGFGTIVDPNGNEMTETGSGSTQTWTDTLGRSWVTTFGISDVSGCPTGGLVAPSLSTTWTIPSPNNGARTFKFCYSVYSIQTSFNNGYYVEYTCPSCNTLMTGVVLPDGTTWRFDYDNNSYGDLIKVVLPTGGYISYTWTTSTGGCFVGDAGTRIVQSRTTYDGNNSFTWNYNFSNGTTTVSDPLGNDTVHSGYSCNSPVTQIKYYSGSSTSGGMLLKTVQKSFLGFPNPFPCDVTQYCGYSGPSLPQTTTTIWPNGEQSQVQLTYDTGFTFTDGNPDHIGTRTYTSVYGLVTKESHSDYANGTPGPVLSITNTIYNYSLDSRYLTANILDLPASVTITDGSPTPNKCSETDYGYDGYARDSSGVSMQHISAPYAVSGNLTSVSPQLFANPVVACSVPNPSQTPHSATYHLFDTGIRHTSTDPLNNPPTTYTYSGTYFGAYPTSICNALNQCTIYGYDFNTGLVTSMKDPNNQTTTWSWDCLFRPTSAIYPDTGQESVSFSYNPSNGGCGTGVTSTFVGGTVTKTATPDPSIVTTQVFDGLGRLKETQLTSDPAGTDYTDFVYDALGRKSSQYNPTRCRPAFSNANCSETTFGFTNYTYDPLNRVTSMFHLDKSTGSTDYSAFPCITVTDEAGKQRKSCVDGLGRMTSVSEDPNNLNYQTSYTYDALDNLLSVTQSGSRQRTFTYDSLSRLTQATNPESGTICYGTYTGSTCQQNGYDANGNLISKTAPKQNQTNPSVTVTTTDSYDALNRIVSTTYSDGTTPASQYLYDNPSSYPNSIGRLYGEYSSSSLNPSKWVSYDAMGRITIQDECTASCAGLHFRTTKAYDLAGNPTSIIYPSGRKVTYSYDGVMQPTQTRFDSFNGTPVGYNYLSSASYAPTDTPTSLTLGSGVIESESYNTRLQPCNLQVASGSLVWLNRTVGYSPFAPQGTNCTFEAGNNNGNVTGIADNLQSNRAQAFTYDNLNRIATAQSAATSGPDCWGQSFGYDAWANLLSEAVTKCSGTQLSVGVNAQNQITNSGVSYDLDGDMLTDGVNTYTYDAENRVVTVNGSGTNYSYDAEGQRVEKNVGAAKTDYNYFNGQPIAEYNSSNGSWSDYIYVGSRRLVRADNYEDTLRIQGTRCSNCGTQWYLFDFPNAAGLVGRVVQAGDKLWWRQHEYPGSVGGIKITFSDSTDTYGVPDNYGNNMAADTNQGGWHYRSVDLSAYAGKIISFVRLYLDTATTGSWDLSFQAISYVSTDGTVQTIYNRYQTVSLSGSGTSGMTNTTYFIYHDTTVSPYPAYQTTYYHGDHLGSARLTTAYEGYPTWSATYLPFGQEWNPQPTVNHHKFTGKERDSESGLDNFGARYYSSQYGRFMTPDWAAKATDVPYADFGNPQSLNLYGYVKNNPLSYTDPDGHQDDPYLTGPIICMSCMNVAADFAQRGWSAARDFALGAVGVLADMTLISDHDVRMPSSVPNNPAGHAGAIVGAVGTTLVEGSSTSEVQSNRAAGLDFEGRALSAEGLTKNTTAIQAVDPKTGQVGTTVPDAIRSNGQTVEMKNVKNLSDSPQLRRQSEISARSGQKGQVVVSNRNQSVSKSVSDRMDVKKLPSDEQ